MFFSLNVTISFKINFGIKNGIQMLSKICSKKLLEIEIPRIRIKKRTLRMIW